MNILGVTAPLSWNSAAAIVVNGKLLAAAEEERFNRIKHSPRMPPYKATQFCLSFAKINPWDIDYLAFGYRSPFIAYLFSTVENIRNQDFTRILREAGAFAEYYIGIIRYKDWLQKIGVDFSKTKICFVPHHIAHSASAYYSSGMTHANILTLDGQGEDDAGMLGVGRNGKIRKLGKIGHHQGLGWVYAETTDILGFQPHSGEGKVMGLAAYGKKTLTRMPWTVSSRSYTLAPFWNISFWKTCGPRRNPSSPLSSLHKNLARTTQQFIEKAGEILARRLYSLSPCENLVLAGGVALNCDMNAKIASLPFVKNLFVYPAADDGGTAVGAAFETTSRLGENVNYQMENNYLGPNYDNKDIELVLRESHIPYKTWSSFHDIARMLAMGKIIGWFNGRMEFGPRALGNRSILAHPGIRGIKEKINAHVKHRESWRPFAPSILDEDGPSLFQKYSYSPFMTRTFPSTSLGVSLFSQAVHIDHTARIQSVRKEVNKKFYDLILAFKNQTSIPGVLNTSFNDADEPIACSPKDALRTFFSTGLHALVIGDYIIQK